MKLNIDLAQLDTLVAQGSKLVMTPDAESAIVKLEAIKEQILLAEQFIKDKIAEDGKKLDPNFTSIQGSKVKASYRVYGAKYAVEPDNVASLPVEMYKVSKRYTAVAEEVEKHLAEHKHLPVGIHMVPRAKQISLRIIDGEIEDEA